MATNDYTSYFILKCLRLEDLQKCIRTGEWACQERISPPHPRDLLSAAHQEGRVILIFSVNNQHGWHGYCESLFTMEKLIPSFCVGNIGKEPDKALNDEENNSTDESKENNCCYEYGKSPEDKIIVYQSMTENSAKSENKSPWHYFPVKWIRHFQEFTKQTCLSSEKTQNLHLPDGTLINKARNWQKLTPHVGLQLCNLIEEYHSKLTLEKQMKEERRLAMHEESYFKAEESAATSDMIKGWTAVIEKVERELGQVHLVCPFGSQRYNCSQMHSDNDIFIVYQAPTIQILGLDQPKQTIKNSYQAVVDYTVLELHRYCELLVNGDPKCIETLFLLDSKVVPKSSPQWRLLCNLKNSLLTKPCFDKYMKEAQGTTGVKQLQKWRDSNSGSEELPPKLQKLSYIILRLLQNARDMVTTRTLKVFRELDSPEREELLSARQGSFTYSHLMTIIDRYLVEVNEHQVSIQQSTDETKTHVQNWLLNCRIQDLHEHPFCGFAHVSRPIL